MRKAAILLLVLMNLGLVSADLNATIQPQRPDVIELNGTNDFSVKKTFDGTSSEGDVTSYAWNLIGSSQSDTGPKANFTFALTDSESNTVRLTVSNSTSSNVDEVPQDLEDVPRVDFAGNDSNIETGEEVKFSSEVNESFDTPVSYEWSVDGTEESTSDNLTTSFGSSGDYSVKLNVTDDSDLWNSTSKTFSVSESSDEESGDEEENDDNQNNDDEADPAPVSPVDNQENETIPENVLKDLEPGVASALSYRKTVSSVSVTAENSIPSLELNMTQKKGKPDNVEDTGREVYQYFEITSNVSEDDLEKAEINFSVRKQWMTSRNITGEDIVLLRHDDNWEELNTSLRSSNSTHTLFSAVTPGFSPFAISTKEPQEPSQDTQDKNGSNQEVTQKENTQESDDSIFSNVSGYMIPLVAVLAILIGLIFYLLYGDNLKSEITERKARSELDKASQRLKKDLKDEDISEGSEAYNMLEQARELYDEGNYEECLKKLDKLERLL